METAKKSVREAPVDNNAIEEAKKKVQDELEEQLKADINKYNNAFSATLKEVLGDAE